MPNLDGTGPKGQGAMTGRKRVRCRDTQSKQIDKAEIQTAENKNTVYEVGRGGGQGQCYGGNNNKGHGRRI